MALYNRYHRKSALIWRPCKQIFEASKMTGNHWHTIGFPLDGTIYLNPEDALFIVASNQAIYQIEDDGEWLESVETLVAFLMPSLLSPTFLRVFLSLRKLGYIVWRPDNPYLDNSFDADLVVFKPNSKFQKKSPSGFLFPLKLVPVSTPAYTFLSSVLLQQKTAFAVYDETGQVYLTLTDVTDKFIL